MSKKLVDFEVLTISPSVAKEMLKTNINNRPPIKSSINHYSRQMSGGKWRMTGEAIKFDEDGNLIDGQCRLMACIQSGCSFTTTVARGLSPEVFNVMDQGSIRTPAHAFGRDGKKRYAMLAAAVRLVWILEGKKKVRFSGRLTIDESYEILAARPNLEKCCELVTEWYTGSIPMPPSIAAGFMSACSNAKTTISMESLEFWKQVITGNELTKGSPAQRLRLTLLNSRLKGEHLHRDTVNALCIKAYNAYISGDEMGRLSYSPKSEKFPELKTK